MPGWSWAWHAELEPFPAAVLAARHPGSVNLGDVLAPDFDERAKVFGSVDVLVGGPPCQAFSVAGNRNSLSDPRGNLSLRWAQIIHAVDPVFAVTENVPGWLNTPDNAFGHFLAALVGADDPLPAPGGRGWPRAGMVAGPLARACWRVLDAQYFGLAQRRERVFIVSSAGERCDPSQILLEPKGLRRHPPSRGEAWQGTPAGPSASSAKRGGVPDADTADNLIAYIKGAAIGRQPQNGPQYGDFADDGTSFTLNCTEVHAVAFAENSRAELRLEGGDGQTVASLKTGGGKPGQSYPAIAVDLQNCALGGEVSGTLDTTRGGGQAVAYDIHGTPATSGATATDVHTPLRSRQPGMSEASTTTVVSCAAAIRRLTPTECERLMGFYDHYTNITFKNKPASDGNRYRALGNSMAVPVLTWLLTRIEAQMAATVAGEEAA